MLALSGVSNPFHMPIRSNQAPQTASLAASQAHVDFPVHDHFAPSQEAGDSNAKFSSMPDLAAWGNVSASRGEGSNGFAPNPQADRGEGSAGRAPAPLSIPTV